MPEKTIYFLCTVNSCSSQMAEGWANHYLGDSWIIKSAGIEDHGLIRRANQAMRGVCIDISIQKSDPIDMEVLNNATMIVTLCGDAADRCPMTPSQINREHWGFDDPGKTEGTDEEKQAVFQR